MQEQQKTLAAFSERGEQKNQLFVLELRAAFLKNHTRMSTSFLPVSDADRVTWLNNFSSRIGQYAGTLGLSAAEVAAVAYDAQMFAYAVQLHEGAHQYAVAVAGMKNQLRSSPTQSPPPPVPAFPNAGSPPTSVNSGIFNRISILVARIKQSNAYSNTIGLDLGIITPVSTVNPLDMVPSLSIRLDAGHPLLHWKKGQADGLNLYVDRRDNNGFVLLAKVFRNTYLDTTPVPAAQFTATWDYKGRYLIGDDEVGQFSTVVSINVVHTA